MCIHRSLNNEGEVRCIHIVLNIVQSFGNWPNKECRTSHMFLMLPPSIKFTHSSISLSSSSPQSILPYLRPKSEFAKYMPCASRSLLWKQKVVHSNTMFCTSPGLKKKTKILPFMSAPKSRTWHDVFPLLVCGFMSVPVRSRVKQQSQAVDRVFLSDFEIYHRTTHAPLSSRHFLTNLTKYLKPPNESHRSCDWTASKPGAYILATSLLHQNTQKPFMLKYVEESCWVPELLALKRQETQDLSDSGWQIETEPNHVHVLLLGIK